MANGVAAVGLGLAFFALFVVAAHVAVPYVISSRRVFDVLRVGHVER